MFTRQTSETTMSGTSSPDGHDSWHTLLEQVTLRRMGWKGGDFAHAIAGRSHHAIMLSWIILD
jgi:hypothetical protein